MAQKRFRTGLWLRFYLFATAWSAPVAYLGLRQRLRKGKEDPNRWQEKRGRATQPRPNGPLVWMHAVGVGEVLALPVLIHAMREHRPDLRFLITSSARTSSDAIARNLPEGAVHQFLPLDCGAYVHRFLEHWQPDLSIWAERDVWPRFIYSLERMKVPLVIVNGRMDVASFEAKNRLRSLFRDVYQRFDSVDVQDDLSARHFKRLGTEPDRITVSGSLKSVGLPLADLQNERRIWEFTLGKRRVWLAASTHAGEERKIAKAHCHVVAKEPDAVLIVVPRDPHRAEQVKAEFEEFGLSSSIVENGLPARSSAQVQIANEIGQMGLWYRLAPISFVGGSLCGVGGHNPYEAARLNSYVLHGPNVRNFAEDYDLFHAHKAAQLVENSTDLASAVLGHNIGVHDGSLERVAQNGQASLQELAARLVAKISV